MRSRLVLAAGLTVATFASGAPRERFQTEEEPRVPTAPLEAAVPGAQHTEVDVGVIDGTVEGATGYVITLDVGRREPLVQVVVKDEDAVRIEQEGREAPLALAELEEGMPVRTWFRNEGGVRVVTSIEVLQPASETPGQER